MVFKKKLKKLLSDSRLGTKGTLVFFLMIIGLGILDALLHQSYPPPGLNFHFPQAIPINPTVARIMWDYASIYFGAIFEVLFLTVFYRPKMKYKEFTVWFVWMGKMLLLAMFIEQFVVLMVQQILVYNGIIPPLDYMNIRYNLWTTDFFDFNLYFTYNQTILFNFICLLLFGSFIILERRLRKRWKCERMMTA